MVVNEIVTSEKLLSNIIGKRQKVVNVIVTSEKVLCNIIGKRQKCSKCDNYFSECII